MTVKREQMEKKNLFIKISSLLLESDKDVRSWKRCPDMEKAWHIVVGSLFIAIILYYIPPAIFDTTSSPLASLLFRIAKLIGTGILTVSYINLSICHYRFLLLKGSDLKIVNTLSIFFGNIILFAAFYKTIYDINPLLFDYKFPPYIPSETIKYIGEKSHKMFLDFIIYSSLNMVMGNYWKIATRSLVVSILEVAQRFYGIFFIVFYFSTYLTKRLSREKVK